MILKGNTLVCGGGGGGPWPPGRWGWVTPSLVAPFVGSWLETTADLPDAPGQASMRQKGKGETPGFWPRTPNPPQILVPSAPLSSCLGMVAQSGNPRCFTRGPRSSGHSESQLPTVSHSLSPSPLSPRRPYISVNRARKYILWFIFTVFLRTNWTVPFFLTSSGGSFILEGGWVDFL